MTGPGESSLDRQRQDELEWRRDDQHQHAERDVAQALPDTLPVEEAGFPMPSSGMPSRLSTTTELIAIWNRSGHDPNACPGLLSGARDLKRLAVVRRGQGDDHLVDPWMP